MTRHHDRSTTSDGFQVPARLRALPSILALGLAGLSATGCSEAEDARPPNVVVVCVDVLRADHVGTYGHERDTTPNVDALAEDGVVFRSAVSPAAWTKPSVPSYFTGRYPYQHGVYHSSFEVGDKTFSDLLPPDETTLAELFQEAGYQTVGVVTNGVIKGRLGFSQGFDDYFDGVGNADKILDRFSEWYEGRTRSLPFFAYIHFLDVHLPYDPPPEYRDFFGEVQTSIDFGTDEWKFLKQRIKLGRLEITDADRDAVAKLYDAQLRYTDDTIGRIVASLRETGEYDDTLFVFLSDHGEELFERGGIGHGTSLHTELVDVPLIFRFPGDRFGGTRISAPVSTVDVLPTLADYCGLRPVADVAGRSLMPMVADGFVDPDRVLYSEGIHGNRYQQSVRRGDWKLVVTVKTRTRTRDILTSDLRVEIDVEEREDGAFEAIEVEVQENQTDSRKKITGPVESIDEEHIGVLGFRLRMGPEVRIEDHEKEPLELAALAPGTTVKVYCEGETEAEMVATRIKVRDPGKKPRRRLEGPISAPIKDGTQLVFTLADREVRMERTLFVTEENSGARLSEGFARSIDPWVAAKEGGVPAEEQLYDLATDPGETTDVLAENEEVAAELRALLEDLREPWSRTTDSVDLDGGELDHLRHLGYIGDDE